MNQLMVIDRQEAFDEIPMDIIEHEGQAWFKAEDIGRALGFSVPQQGVLNLFNRNQEDFEGLTCKLTASLQGGQAREYRVFSVHGVFHIIAIAKTERGEELRKWLVSFLLKQNEVQSKRILALEFDKRVSEGVQAKLVQMVNFRHDRRSSRGYTARAYTPSTRMTPEEIAEIQAATNQLMAKCAPLQVIKHGEHIPDTMPFFILQRPYEKPHIYARLEKVRLGLVAMGHRWSIKRLAMAYRDLGHQPEHFKWGKTAIRGWAMEMAAIAGGVPDMIPLSLN